MLSISFYLFANLNRCFAYANVTAIKGVADLVYITFFWNIFEDVLFVNRINYIVNNKIF